MNITLNILELLKIININGTISQSMLSRRSNITYSHVHHVIKEFNEMRLIKVTRSGRTTFLSLTKKGIKVCDAYSIIKQATKVRT